MNDLKEAFDIMDENEDGMISKKDFIYLITEMGLSTTPSQNKEAYTYKDFLFHIRTETSFASACKRLSSYRDSSVSAAELVSVMSKKFNKQSIMFLLNNTMNDNGRIKIDSLL